MRVQNPVIVYVDGTIKYKKPTDKFGTAYMAIWSSCSDYMHTSKVIKKTNNSNLVELIALKETMKYLLNRRSKRMRFILCIDSDFAYDAMFNYGWEFDQSKDETLRQEIESTRYLYHAYRSIFKLQLIPSRKNRAHDWCRKHANVA